MHPVHGTRGVRTILLVDDDAASLATLAEGLAAHRDEFRVLTAPGGQAALDLLASRAIDLVVTDLRMPGMDGVELITRMRGHFPRVPVVVMTGQLAPDGIRRLATHGRLRLLPKPFEFAGLVAEIRDALATEHGHLQGIALPTFLQLVEMEGKSYVLDIRAPRGQGRLYFVRGELVDAVTDWLTGEDAALEIAGWEETAIDIRPLRQKWARRIPSSLNSLLMEACRRRDEGAVPVAVEAPVSPEPSPRAMPARPAPVAPAGVVPAELVARLETLRALGGFAGAALLTPSGEPLACAGGERFDLAKVGRLANDVLVNAQCAALEMGAGRAHLAHVETEGGHVLVRCLDAGAATVVTPTGRSHLHLVVVLRSDAALAAASRRMAELLGSLVETLRAA